MMDTLSIEKNVYKTRWMIYSTLVSLTLLFHVYNKLQINDYSLKLFHVAAAMAMISGVFLLKKPWSKIAGITFLFLVGSFVSCALSPYDGSMGVWIKSLIIIGSMMFILTVPLKYIVVGINMIIPLVIISLLLLYFSGSYFRFQGFYNDPNYLCVTLLACFFFIQLLWEINTKKIIRICLVIESLLVFYLVATTVSRTGMLCFVLTASFWGWRLFKENKIITLLIAIIMIGGIVTIESGFIDKIVDNFTERRVGQGDTIGHASGLRREISMRGINYVIDNPQFWLQGIGMGGTSHANSYSNFHVRTKHGDHNTITSCFTEQGVVGLSLFSYFLFSVFLAIYNQKQMKYFNIRQIAVGTFLVFVFFSMSINLMVYLPFWLVLFTLANIGQNEDITCSMFW